LLYEFFKCFNMGTESVFAGFSSFVTCIWLFADELLFDDNIIFRFKCLGVAGQVAIGNAEQFLERVEIGRIIDHQHRHDSEPDPVVKSLIDILDDVFQKGRSDGLIAVVFIIHDAPVNNVANAKAECPEF